MDNYSYTEGFIHGIGLAIVWNGGCNKSAPGLGNVLLGAWCSAQTAILAAPYIMCELETYSIIRQTIPGKKED